MRMSKKHNKSNGRRYDLEYARYQGRPSQIRRRSLRNKARRKMVKRFGRAKVRGKDVDHKKFSRGNSYSNLRIVSKSRNRGFRRSKTGKNLGLPRR